MKKTNSNLILLNVIFAVSIVIANMVGCKVINLPWTLFGLPLALSGGAITYAFTFLCTDIIGETWGEREAKKSVLYGLAAQLYAVTLVILTQLTPTNDAEMQSAYVRLLGQSPIFVLGSLSGYFCSQKWDVWVFHRIREKWIAKHGTNKHRWIWNNASTLTSQAIDTIIYACISFGLGMGFFFRENGVRELAGIVIGQYLLKALLALIDTPIFYLLTNREQVKQNE